MSTNTWTRAASLEALRTKGRVVFRKSGRQIALFDTLKGCSPATTAARTRDIP